MKIERREFKRKLLHIFFGILVVILINQRLIEWEHMFLLIIISIIVSFLSKKYPIPIIIRIIRHMERDENLKKFPFKGVIFYFIGIFLVLSFRNLLLNCGESDFQEMIS